MESRSKGTSFVALAAHRIFDKMNVRLSGVVLNHGMLSTLGMPTTIHFQQHMQSGERCRSESPRLSSG